MRSEKQNLYKAQIFPHAFLILSFLLIINQSLEMDKCHSKNCT